MTYFERFLELIQKDFNIKQETRSIYIADCRISMASCKLEQNQHDKAKAYLSFK